MHWEVHQFVSSISSLLPKFFTNSRVLEVGSYYANESIRDIFVNCNYIGVDLSAGPGVDIVCSGHEFYAPSSFHAVLSCECFEHNPYFKQTFKTMVNNTIAGGLVLFTAATVGRSEHGTTRTDPSLSPGSSEIGWDYYRNIVSDDFDLEFIETHFKSYYFFSNEHSHDM